MRFREAIRKGAQQRPDMAHDSASRLFVTDNGKRKQL